MDLKSRYYNGKKSNSFLVSLQLQGEGFWIIDLENDIKCFWQYAAIRILQSGEYNTSTILSNTMNPEERLLINKSTLDSIKTYLVPLKSSPITRFFSRKFLYFFALTLIPFVIFLFYSMPGISKIISEHIPLRLEITMGDYAAHNLFSKKELIKNPDKEKLLLKIVDQLKKANNIQRDFSFYIVANDNPPNAFCLPNGNIYIFKSLLESVDSPEELAGVIAHEMAHIIKHHSMITLIKNTTLSLLMKSIFGVKSEYAELMLNPYNQDLEKEADATAGKMLYLTNVGTEGLQAFFRKLEENDLPLSFLSFLSTHPLGKDRLTLLQKIPTPINRISILTKSEWKILKE